MQAVVPTGDHNPNEHTSVTILNALYGRYGSRRWTFRYDLLDSTNAFVSSLDAVNGTEPVVLAGRVEQNWLADIKRTATFVIKDSGDIDYLSDRIQPWARLRLPPYGTDDWVEWPMGVFLLSSPSRRAEPTGMVVREVQAYDQLQVLAEDRLSSRLSYAEGTAYTTAVSGILTTAGIPSNITHSSTTIPTDTEWEPGTTYLKVVNDLLSAINYNSLSIDEWGRAIVSPYVAPSDRAEEWLYADGDESLTIPGVEQELDLFSVPNKWILVCSEPDRDPIVGTYTNNDPASPTSTVNRARTIVDFRTEQLAADEPTLTEKAYRLGFEASQIYEAIPFSTALNPLHSGNDVYRIRHQPLAVDAKYSEHSWSVDLRAGAQMQHRARRVVSIGTGV